ncbi:uncharacterized protein LOC118146261 isoform X1 [Callithrix jacchus]|uniref:proline-rich protein HaeIII subfamily 1-like isoform X1 n=1 Tax=Callithrix jacchus TaxID=9483 RepID=UPI0023DD651E|nr:proline-rich protein HaeIII subfamily 1-like isoform X1 [Callithrix jacchus]
MPRPGSRPPSDLRARGLTVKLGPPVTSPQSRPLEPQLPASRPGPEGAPDSKTAAPGPSAGGGLDSALRGPRNRAAPPRSGPVRRCEPQGATVPAPPPDPAAPHLWPCPALAPCFPKLRPTSGPAPSTDLAWLPPDSGFCSAHAVTPVLRSTSPLAVPWTTFAA